MREATRKVYYCDFCKKRLMRIDAMKKHEKYCTANLDRECRMCGEIQEVSPDFREVIKKLKSRYLILESQSDNMMLAGIISYSIRWTGEEITSQTLYDFANGCPACMLTLFRQLDEIAKPQDFNYQKELKSFWNDVNSRKRDEMQMDNYTIY
jgi:hypothetical protein